MDAATVERITGVKAGTINMWIQRRLVPGMSVGTQGSAREFDIDVVLHVAVMGALGRLGFAAPFSAMAAGEALENAADVPGARLIISPPRKGTYGLSVTPSIDVWWPRLSEEFDDFLNGFVDGRPEAYTIVELDRLAARVRQEFKVEADQQKRGLSRSSFRLVSRGWEKS